MIVSLTRYAIIIICIPVITERYLIYVYLLSEFVEVLLELIYDERNTHM